MTTNTAPTTLNPSAITRLVRSRGIYAVSHRRSSGAVRVVPIVDDNPAAARAIVALLLQAGYDATRTQVGAEPGDAVLVTLPEPEVAPADTYSAAYAATWAAFHAEPAVAARRELEAAAAKIAKAAERAGLELDTLELAEEGRQQALAAEARREGVTVQQLERRALGLRD